MTAPENIIRWALKNNTVLCHNKASFVQEQQDESQKTDQNLNTIKEYTVSNQHCQNFFEQQKYQ